MPIFPLRGSFVRLCTTKEPRNCFASLGALLGEGADAPPQECSATCNLAFAGEARSRFSPQRSGGEVNSGGGASAPSYRNAFERYPQSAVEAAGFDSLLPESDFDSEEPESELFDSLEDSEAPLPPPRFVP
jgi:hypothetical protein